VLDQGANISIDCFGHAWSLELTGWILERDFHRLGGLIALVKGEGYCRLTKFVIPSLRDVGVSDFDIRQMTVENPARLLAV
jgi:phosphotriesterase-related protein